MQTITELEARVVSLKAAKAELTAQFNRSLQSKQQEIDKVERLLFNLTRIKAPAFATINAGDLVNLSYRKTTVVTCAFIGFTDNKQAHGDLPVYRNAAAMKAQLGVKSWAEIEKKDHFNPYGYSHYACFVELETGDTFEAYLFHGNWCVGSSADRALLS